MPQEPTPETSVRAVLQSLEGARKLAKLKELPYIIMESEEVEALEQELKLALSKMTPRRT